MHKNITPRLKEYIVLGNSGDPVAPTIKTLDNDEALKIAIKVAYPERIIESAHQETKYTMKYWIAHTYRVTYIDRPHVDRIPMECITVLEEIV